MGNDKDTLKKVGLTSGQLLPMILASIIIITLYHK